ncbi:hypothetical protein C8A00DRAFT_19363 [Chaetomidium leptoderma]|uniref:Zinc ribbon domain-containing protein n=1 Tax=Chaetomidium leptoderma TaxID=669021 RepID=A0AAN6ZSX6_9PEZI|nr:hypothetical protein C8A00DRAFT_19363 [Chaetomidium leptoderma]
MSYQMSGGQNMAYPYPPPAAAVAAPPRSRFSKWWPISFFISAVLFFIIGGGLIGGYSATAYDCLDSYYSCSGVGNNGMWYGAVACFALGAICKLVAWILFIVWCVKRDSRQPASIAYTYQPLSYANAPVAPTAAVPAYQQNATAYQNAPPYQHAQAPAPAHSKEPTGMGTRYCGQCGAGVTTAFCPHCGIQV